MPEVKFYDSHCHVMNLSHPNLLAFLQPLNIAPLLLFAPLIPCLNLISPVFSKKYNRLKNLLSVMENDLGTFFLLVEKFLVADASLYQLGCLVIGGKRYTKLVLTPLLIDFGYKDQTNPGIYYHLPAQKPIVNQVCDVFNGIKKYQAESKYHLFEIHPFLGLNTQNYFYSNETSTPVAKAPGLSRLSLALQKKVKYNPVFKKLVFFGEMTVAERLELENLFDTAQDRHLIRLLFDKSQNMARRNTLPKLLDKYFSEYRGLRSEQLAHMGKFNGNIEEMGSNFFAGIKVYPPLGFDPWPEGDEEELIKVKYLYEYCSAKQIPITAHCNSGGFVVLESRQARCFTAPERWEKVLYNYPELILNLAHFGKQGKIYRLFPNRQWTRQIIDMIDRFDQLYVDFSFNGINKKYYHQLRHYLDQCPPPLREKLRHRILFGSDFMINLIKAESYNQYLQIFSDTPCLSPAEQHLFGSINPERFLFGEYPEAGLGLDWEVAVAREDDVGKDYYY